MLLPTPKIWARSFRMWSIFCLCCWC